MAMVVAATVSPALGGVPAQAGDAKPTLEKVAAMGMVVAQDDKSRFDLRIKGHGFEPGEKIKLDVGTDQAVGVLSGAPVMVTVDKNGNIPEMDLHPKGITTHGSTEKDFTCKAEDVERGRCKEHEIGNGVQEGSVWRSTTVHVAAYREVQSDASSTPYSDVISGRRRSGTA
ncbi:hypothetical protein ACFT5C_27440 [Streptomyces sp. NPDC057116]|uniref:hypothetical protein n=1 Tax=Streptomyces sp. NPDC057116 TaxID=3346023 RepID=UPI003632A6E1